MKIALPGVDQAAAADLRTSVRDRQARDGQWLEALGRLGKIAGRPASAVLRTPGHDATMGPARARRRNRARVVRASRQANR